MAHGPLIPLTKANRIFPMAFGLLQKVSPVTNKSSWLLHARFKVKKWCKCFYVNVSLKLTDCPNPWHYNFIWLSSVYERIVLCVQPLLGQPLCFCCSICATHWQRTNLNKLLCCFCSDQCKHRTTFLCNKHAKLREVNVPSPNLNN